ncbi:uncharacterized protein LOC135195315 [Macrobrachium nipponense]|uniref:uncharacterized protein LOC135195315 n=1 Tax=Macrobrachium nipponense TaxID=159736 RepID=UPI0030C8317C
MELCSALKTLGELLQKTGFEVVKQRADTGVPVLLKTDGGPQFASSALRRFLSRWGVEHHITSQYYPKANGHAEASVKIIKKLVMTTAKNGNLDADEFARGMLELRNTPHADGRSPAQVLFGHPLRSFIPTHRRSFAKEWQKKAEECDVKAEYLRSQAKQRYCNTARPLSHLKVGSYVDVQDHTTGVWNHPGIVVGIGSSKPKDVEKSQDNSTAEVISKSILPTPAPGRSLRHRKEPDRLQGTPIDAVAIRAEKQQFQDGHIVGGCLHGSRDSRGLRERAEHPEGEVVSITKAVRKKGFKHQDFASTLKIN